MRILLLVGLLLAGQDLYAASLNGCDTPVRVGQRVLRQGDDMGRALSAIRRASHKLKWRRGPSGTRWTLVRGGRNPRTIHIRLKQGRIDKLCQYSG